ncbi:MAG: ferritin [Spirochaetes bacterium]|nr:ferritin [Spirochaetota bacterium]
MIGKKLESELNKQINAELYSAYLYLAMSAFFEDKNLKGFANWTRVQAQEEVSHAMKIFDYVNERGGRATMAAIDGPENEWKDTIAVFDQIYQHEQKVTGLINHLVDLATAEKDHATFNMLQWFVAEQVEEEASASEILEKLKFIDGNGAGLIMLDKELEARVFTPPAAE